jgi:hypothetical protein
MAGFQLTLHGRIWVIPEARSGWRTVDYRGSQKWGYHIVDRWSPTNGESRALGLFMVNELAKMKLAASEVY